MSDYGFRKWYCSFQSSLQLNEIWKSNQNKHLFISKIENPHCCMEIYNFLYMVAEIFVTKNTS